MSVSERDYLSIGEVLALLQEEFPDVTISKIRFLESQGLIEPERTHSGYRKFYGADVERLRFILREQREKYLPLRVIRDRLDSGPAEHDGLGPDEAAPDAATATHDGDGDGFGDHIGPADAATDTPAAPPEPSPLARRGIGPAGPAPTAPDVAPAAAGEPAPAEPHVPLWLRKAPPGVQQRPIAAAPEPAPPPPPPHAAAAVTAVPSAPTPAVAEPVVAVAPTLPVPPAVDDTATYTAEELARAAGVEVALVRELDGFGLVHARSVGRTPYYDALALQTVRVAAEFARHGIEARHLRMYKTAVEREASLFEQVILPLAKQRNPKSRAQATDALHELAGHGATLRSLLVANAIRALEP